jgi:neutral ceramidase
MSTIPTAGERALTRRDLARGAASGALLLSACAAPRTAAGRPDRPLLAGAAEAVVTPDAGVVLVGSMKPATGVHDDLVARALVLSDGETSMAIVTLDYIGFDFDYIDVLIDAVAKASGIPAAHVMINCSHTHGSPITAPWGPWEKAKDKPFHAMLPRKLGEIVQQAQAAAKPARLRRGREPIQIGFNRRLLRGDAIEMAPNPHGAVIPWVDLLAVEEENGKPIAVLFSHAAHPVIVHNTSTLITADYPGFAVKAIQQTRGKDGGLALFAQGCCGNVNAFPLRGGLDAAAAVGRDLAKAVGRALTDAAPVEGGRLKVVSAELSLPLQPPPPIEECRRMMETEKAPDKIERWRQLAAIAESGRPTPMPFRIRAAAVGNSLCLLGLSHEPFAEYHLHVERITPFKHTLVFGYTNGLESYIGTEKDYRLGVKGGYETSPRGAAIMFERRLPPAPEAERLIHAGIARVLREARQA